MEEWVATLRQALQSSSEISQERRNGADSLECALGSPSPTRMHARANSPPMRHLQTSACPVRETEYTTPSFVCSTFSFFGLVPVNESHVRVVEHLFDPLTIRWVVEHCAFSFSRTSHMYRAVHNSAANSVLFFCFLAVVQHIGFEMNQVNVSLKCRPSPLI